jgi:hypothetical protein
MATLKLGMRHGVQESRYQFLSLMATLKLGMKQGLQESRYPISLIHGYSQIGDETWTTRVKLPNTTAQRQDDVIEKLFIYMQMFGTLKKAPGVQHNKYPKEVLETCKERKRCL